MDILYNFTITLWEYPKSKLMEAHVKLPTRLLLPYFRKISGQPDPLTKALIPPFNSKQNSKKNKRPSATHQVQSLHRCPSHVVSDNLVPRVRHVYSPKSKLLIQLSPLLGSINIRHQILFLHLVHLILD